MCVSISIIIPVYNAEKYLGRCLDSIICQNFNDYEIIVVDDGSTDNSYSIAKKYGNDKVYIYRQKNRGVSTARNTGLIHASGEYVVFVDADDCLTEGSLKAFNEDIKRTHADLIISGFYEEQDNGTLVNKNILNSPINKYDLIKDTISYYVCKNRWNANLRCVWAKCFRTELIKKYNLKFDMELKVGEDMVFLLSFILLSNHISLLNHLTYVYKSNNKSVMHSIKWSGTEQGTKLLGDVYNLAGSLVSDSCMAALWFETAERDWLAIEKSNLSYREKKTTFKKLFNSEKYKHFTNQSINCFCKRQVIYNWLIRKQQYNLFLLFFRGIEVKRTINHKA